jgi:transcriptional regulator with XRE-family HTH domain
VDPVPDPGLAWLRSAAGLTQQQLADDAGIHLKRYEAAEAGRRDLPPEDISRLAQTLSIPAGEVRAAVRRNQNHGQ